MSNNGSMKYECIYQKEWIHNGLFNDGSSSYYFTTYNYRENKGGGEEIAFLFIS